MTLLGVVQIFTFFGFFVAFDIPLSVFNELDVKTNAILLGVALMTLLVTICGVNLLKGEQKIHWLALPVSVVIMFAFPVGTIVGGLYLLERRKNS